MTPKRKSPRKPPAQQEWAIYLGNGEFFASLFFSRAEVRKLFKTARITGDNSVYL